MSDVSEMRTVSEQAVEILTAAGVRRCYTVPGESFLELTDAMEQHPDFTVVSTRHEGGAAFMADADAKFTGVPAVAAATRGPGATNLAVGVHTAQQDSTPMIVFLGQVETDFLGREAFQEVDLTAFYRPITKWATTVHRADRLAEVTAQAIRVATSGRPGPVSIAVPEDLFGQRVGQLGPVAGVATVPRPSLTGEDRDQLSTWLGTAERPVLIAGGGTRDARENLIAVAERYNAGVFTSWRRQDHFPNNHPLYLGHLGLGCPTEILNTLEGADAILVVGSRLSEITTQTYRLPTPGEPGSTPAVAQIDIDASQVGTVTKVWLGAVADANEALSSLAEVAPSSAPARDWSSAHNAWVETTRAPANAAEHPGPGLHPASVVERLCRAVPAETILSGDAGNFAAFLQRGWNFDTPRTQLAPTSGAMGYAVPGAVAAKLAAPERTVLAVAGDGGALMTGQELETAVRFGLPIVVVVFQNGLYGTIAMHQALRLGRTAAVTIGSPLDLAGWARGLGAHATTATTLGELDKGIAAGLAATDTPTLVDVRTDPDVISPTATLSGLLSQG